MKNLKYLQVFEAFESETLTKVFNYVNSKQKGHFKTILSDLCDKLNFPMSDLSDDLFQYLSFNKALQLTANIEDQPCDNESDTIPNEVCSGPTGDAEQGTIMRTWGRGRRRVECPVCKGTGIKPKTSFPIKWIKFWFDKDGKYVTSTITDGQIRDQDTSYGGGKLDTDLNNYERAEKVRWDELSNYNQGDFFLFSDGSSNGTGVAMLWKSGGQNFMLQNFASGSEPGSSEWRKVARYSWVVTSSSDLRGGSVIKLNPKKKVEDNESEEKKPDPYSWNALFNLRNLSVQRSSKVKEELQPAHFALVLDYVKMKEKTKESTFKDTQVTKQKRAESRIDAAALKLPNDIKAENYERYIQKISRSIKVTSDITSIRNIFMRVLGLQYAGHYVLQGLHFGELDTIMDKIIGLMLTYEKSIEEPESEDWQSIIKVRSDSISSNMRDAMETTIRYNKNMKENLDYMYTNSPSPEHTKVIDKLIQVNKVICDKIRNTKLDSIEDAVIFYGKITRMREDFKHSALFKEALKASDVNYYLESSDSDRCLRYLVRINTSEIPQILRNFDQYINYINKL
jgi:hypothetical protein